MSNEFRHQGDVTFHPVEQVEGKVIKHEGSYTLAYGEKTGHRHLITVENPSDMRLFQALNGQVFLDILSSATITHEEHLPITLQPGKYLVEKEREYDWFQKTARKVID